MAAAALAGRGAAYNAYPSHQAINPSRLFWHRLPLSLPAESLLFLSLPLSESLSLPPPSPSDGGGPATTRRADDDGPDSDGGDSRRPRPSDHSDDGGGPQAMTVGGDDDSKPETVTVVGRRFDD